MKSLLRDPLTEWKRMIESNIESMQGTKSTCLNLTTVASRKVDGYSSQIEQKHTYSEVKSDTTVCNHHELINEMNKESKNGCTEYCYKTELSSLENEVDPESNDVSDKILERRHSVAKQTEINENRECLSPCINLDVDECDSERHFNRNVRLVGDNNSKEEHLGKSEINFINNHSNSFINLETDSQLFHADSNLKTGDDKEVSNRPSHDREFIDAKMCLVNETGNDVGECAVHYKDVDDRTAKMAENKDGININGEFVIEKLSLKSSREPERDSIEKHQLYYNIEDLNNTGEMSRRKVITRDLSNEDINKEGPGNDSSALSSVNRDLRNSKRGLSKGKRDLINNNKDLGKRYLSKCRASTRELSNDKISARDNNKSFKACLNIGTVNVEDSKHEQTSTKCLSNERASRKNLSNTKVLINDKKITRDISNDTASTRVLINVKAHRRDFSSGRPSTKNLSSDKANVRDLTDAKRDMSIVKRDLSYDRRDLDNGKKNLSSVKKDFSNGKGDLSNGKRDLSNGDRDLSTDKTDTRDQSIGKTNTGDLRSGKTNLKNDKRNLSSDRKASTNGIRKTRDMGKGKGDLSNDKTKTSDLENVNLRARDHGNDKDSTKNLSVCKKSTRDLSNCKKTLSNDKSSTYLINKDNTSIWTIINGTANTRDLNNSKRGTGNNKDTGDLRISNVKTNTGNASNSKDIANDNIRKRSQSSGNVNISDFNNRKINRQNLSNEKTSKNVLGNENIIDKVTDNENINTLNFCYSKTSTQGLCNDKPSTRILSKGNSSTQVLSNGKETECSELLNMKCQPDLYDMDSVACLENIIDSKDINKKYEHTLISNETTGLNMNKTNMFHVKDIDVDSADCYFCEATNVSSAGMTGIQGELNSVKDFSCGDGSSRVYSSSNKVQINTVGLPLHPLRAFKQKRIHKCSSAENIPVRNRQGRERKCRTKIMKSETVDMTSSVDVEMPQHSITRAKSASEGYKRGHNKNIDYVSMQCLEFELAGTRKLDLSNLNKSWKKCRETTENVSHGKLKHLTRNPMTQWKRLVDINMESMLKSRTSGVDRAKYGGGDCQVSIKNKTKNGFDTVLEKNPLKLQTSLQQTSVLKTVENEKCCQNLVHLVRNADIYKETGAAPMSVEYTLHEKIVQSENKCVCLDKNNVYSKVICDIIHTTSPAVSLNNKNGELSNEHEKETSLNYGNVETTLLNYKNGEKSTYYSGYKEISEQEHLSQADQSATFILNTVGLFENEFCIKNLNEINVLDVASDCGQDVQMIIQNSESSSEMKQITNQYEVNLGQDISGQACLLGSNSSVTSVQNSVGSDLYMSKVTQLNHTADSEELKIKEPHVVLYQTDSGSKGSLQNAGAIPNFDKTESVITPLHCIKDVCLTSPINNMTTDFFSVLDNFQNKISASKSIEIFNEAVGDSCFMDEMHAKVPDKLFSLQQIESKTVWNQCNETEDTRYNLLSKSHHDDTLDTVVRHIYEINDQNEISCDHLLPLQENKGCDQISSYLFTKYNSVDKKINKTPIEVLDELALPQDIDNKPPSTVWSRFSSFVTSFFRGPSKELTSNINRMLEVQKCPNNIEHNFIGHTNKNTCLEAKLFKSNIRNDNSNNEEKSFNNRNIGINANGEKCIANGNILMDDISVTEQAKVPSISLLDKTSNCDLGMSTAEKFSSKIGKKESERDLFDSIQLENKRLTSVPSEHNTGNDRPDFKINAIHTKPGCEVFDEEKTIKTNSGMHEMFMKNSSYSHSFQGQKKQHNFKTKIPVLISNSYNRKTRKCTNMNMLNIIKDKGDVEELINENGDKIRNNYIPKKDTFTTNVSSNDLELINIFASKKNCQNVTCYNFYNEEKESKHEKSGEFKEKTEKDNLVCETKYVENNKEKRTAENSITFMSKTDLQHNCEVPVKEKLSITTGTILNVTNFCDSFKNAVKPDYETEPVTEHAPGCCREENSEFVGSDLLQSSLECLLEMLLQRGKIMHAVIANVDGEVIAKTANFDFTSDIKRLVCSLSSTYQGMVKMAIFNDVYTCFKHGQDSSLIGMAVTGIFVAQRGKQSIVVGFSDPQTPGSCIKEIKEISNLLHKRGL